MVDKKFIGLDKPDITRFESYLPTAFSSELTLLQKVNMIIQDLNRSFDLSNEMVDYLNRFIESFDDKLYETLEDVLSAWLEDGRLADVVRVTISEEVIEARTDYLGHTYLNLKKRLDDERKEVVLARGGSQTLGERLDNINSQIAINNNVIVSVEKFGASNASNFDSAEAIQSAIDFVSLRGGGEVRIPRGLWRTSKKIVLKHNVSLVGAGLKATTIQLLSGANDHVIEFESKPWKTGGTYQRLENMTLNGNKSSVSGVSHGVYAPSSVMYTLINNVEAYNCLTDGFHYVSSHRNILKNAISENNGRHGFTLFDENAAGVGTNTDNHVEMNFLTSSNNGGNGYHFINPVDIRGVHLSSMTNKGDGFYIENPSGGWCNILDTLMSQGDANGFVVKNGSSLTVNNLSVSLSTGYCLSVTNLDYSILSNIQLLNGGLGNGYFNDFSLGNITNVISRTNVVTNTNLDFTLSSFNNIDNIKTDGGLVGMDFRSNSRSNNVNNVEVRNTRGYAIKHQGIASTYTAENIFTNVYFRKVGLDITTSAFFISNSEKIVVSGVRVSDSPTLNYIIDLSTSPYCVVSDSIVSGVIEGVRKHQDNLTSIISASVINGTL